MGFLPQAWIEWEEDLVPGHNVTIGFLQVFQIAALQKAKVSEVVHRVVGTSDLKWWLARTRQDRLLGKNRIESHSGALITLTPHPEKAAELLFQGVATLLISRDCQTNRSGRGRIRRATHTFP